MRGHINRRDVEVTNAADYWDKRSHVTHVSHKGPSQEFLFGADMSYRRAEVFLRDKGICQSCGWPVPNIDWELHHIKSRGRGGDDSMSNLQVLHVRCHRGPSGHHA